MDTQTEVIDDDVTLDDLVLSKRIPIENPKQFPEHKWKWVVSNREHNGLGPAFHKVGRNLYVNKRKLAQCIAAQPSV